MLDISITFLFMVANWRGQNLEGEPDKKARAGAKSPDY